MLAPEGKNIFVDYLFLLKIQWIFVILLKSFCHKKF